MQQMRTPERSLRVQPGLVSLQRLRALHQGYVFPPMDLAAKSDRKKAEKVGTLANPRQKVGE